MQSRKLLSRYHEIESAQPFAAVSVLRWWQIDRTCAKSAETGDICYARCKWKATRRETRRESERERESEMRFDALLRLVPKPVPARSGLGQERFFVL